ncbi:amidinotransferase [Streptomyces sp. NBC_01013]|uniref:amidinotransferase n=1 Tax=Streptomyces sp. NBC_01013 TaxID=2903718 RepID=UPI003869AF5D|nr:amidinotransferase [Streptomyces sp. NBC_01013]
MSESEGATGSPVSAYNEWDPLEEVIVGTVDGAHFPPYDTVTAAPLSAEQRAVFRERAGKPFPPEQVAAAKDELDQLVEILQNHGVRVRRPDPRDHGRSYGAPGWASTGLYDAMPRDLLLVIGERIIEAPMAWRSRYFASSAYRPLLKEYFRAGARWSAAPRPELSDELYVEGWTDQPDGEPFRSVITEFEPTFDAADFIRCGRDIFVQRSHVTNMMGIEWVRREIGDEYQVHVVDLVDDHPMHIDASLMPLAPGKLLIHPDRVVEVPSQFKNWEIRRAPEPAIPDGHPLYMTSKWINMNILMLDETKMLVEAEDRPMQELAESWGITPIPCPFRNFNSFGGSFHCATTDVRRRGELQSYL